MIFLLLACAPKAPPQPPPPPVPMTVVDVVVGEGALAEKGARVEVHYTGMLENGRVFDSSVERGIPFTFTLGGGQVISGWDQGVQGMREGGQRRLTIPPHLAYGSRGAGPIPPNSTLVFDIELLSVAWPRTPPEHPEALLVDQYRAGPGGMRMADLGPCPAASEGPLRVEWSAWDERGRLLSSTLEDGRPVTVEAGADWTQALTDMGPGCARQLVLPEGMVGPVDGAVTVEVKRL